MRDLRESHIQVEEIIQKINWALVKGFKREEFDDPDFPGSGDRIDGIYLERMVSLRNVTGWKISIHHQVGGAVDVKGSHGHSVESYHRVDCGSCASDWHFLTNAPVREQVREVMKAGFGGTGIYYDWGVPVGFHTDTRPRSDYQIWTRENGKYIYLVKG